MSVSMEAHPNYGKSPATYGVATLKQRCNNPFTTAKSTLHYFRIIYLRKGRCNSEGAKGHIESWGCDVCQIWNTWGFQGKRVSVHEVRTAPYWWRFVPPVSGVSVIFNVGLRKVIVLHLGGVVMTALYRIPTRHHSFQPNNFLRSFFRWRERISATKIHTTKKNSSWKTL